MQHDDLHHLQRNGQQKVDGRCLFAAGGDGFRHYFLRSSNLAVSGRIRLIENESEEEHLLALTSNSLPRGNLFFFKSVYITQPGKTAFSICLYVNDISLSGLTNRLMMEVDDEKYVCHKSALNLIVFGFHCSLYTNGRSD